MAGHGKSRHLKRLVAPRAASVSRKEFTWVKKPLAGGHEKTEAVALGVLLRDVLGVAEDMASAKKLAKEGMVLVDGEPARELARPVGFMDAVSIPRAGKHYRLLLTKGVLRPFEITEEEARAKLCKITDKKMVRKGRIQLCLHDGRSYLIEREEDVFRAGDTLKLRVPEQKANGFLKLEKGALCYVTHGKHSGEVGVLEKLFERAGSRAAEARLDAGGKKIITLKDYVFVVDKGFRAKTEGTTPSALPA